MAGTCNKWVIAFAISVIALLVVQSVAVGFATTNTAVTINSDNNASARFFIVGAYSYSGYSDSTPDSFSTSNIENDFTPVLMIDSDSSIDYTQSGSTYLIDDDVKLVSGNAFLILNSEGYPSGQSFDISLEVALDSASQAAYGNGISTDYRVFMNPESYIQIYKGADI